MSARSVPISADMLQRSDLAAGAILLYELLVDQQTSADGQVFYGKAISYAWIQSRYLRGSLRSLRRHMCSLKAAGFVELSREFHGGIRVRLLRSVKFAKPLAAPAVQLSLPMPRVVPIEEARASRPRPTAPVEPAPPVSEEKLCKTCESTKKNTANFGRLVRPKLAAERSSKKERGKTKSEPPHCARGSPVENIA